MREKRIAVLVSGGGTNLQALIDAEGRGELGSGKITLVVASKPGVFALERAAKAGIEGRVLARRDWGSIADYSRALADTLTEAKIDLVVLAGFLTIIDEQVYEAFPNRIINVHPALIPSFCGKGFYGLHVHEAALAKGHSQKAYRKTERTRLYCHGKADRKAYLQGRHGKIPLRNV